MSTAISNVKTDASPNEDGSIHLILQGKGGVGKSVIATWLAEFLIGRGRHVRCIDGDPVNSAQQRKRHSWPRWSHRFLGPVKDGSESQAIS